MDVYMNGDLLVYIEYTDSAGGSGSVGLADGNEVLDQSWDFDGGCATGYAVANIGALGLVFEYLKIESELPTAF
jgi:hypothetical protein